MVVIVLQQLRHGDLSLATKPDAIDKPVLAVSLMNLDCLIGVLRLATMFFKFATIGKLVRFLAS